MKSMPKLLALAALFASSFAFAQESAVLGKYSGSYESGARTTITIVLDIKSIQNGEITGTATRNSNARKTGGLCSGEYQVVGTLKDNTLKVRSTEKGGPAGDCTFTLTGVVEGGKVLAKLGQNEFVMSK